MGIEVELIVLLIIQTLGHGFFAKFEGETPAIQKVLKWSIFHTITITLYYFVGHYAILFPLILILAGSIIHVRRCKKHSIHPVRATPKAKYNKLRGRKDSDYM